MDLKPDVLIVGAGISGTAMAISLRRRGLSVLLVERDAQVRERFKGEYLQPVAVQRLEKLGLGQVIDGALKDGEATAIRELRFRDLASGSLLSKAFSFISGSGTSGEPLSDVLVRYPQGSRGISISQHALSARLREVARLELQGDFLEGVELKLQSKNLDRPRFLANGVRILPRLVIGADGRNSTVRGWMGGPKAAATGKPVVGAETEFLVGVDFETDARLPHRYEVIRTAGEGTFSFFQLSSGRQRLYWNTQDATAGKQGWRERISAILDSQVSQQLGQKSEIGQLAGAPANTAWMGPVGKGRFLLVGDAVAVTTPLGGQGMAFALEQVERLAEEIPALFKGSTGARRLSVEQLRRVSRRHHASSRRYFHHINLMNLFLYHLCFSRSRVARHLSRAVFSHWNQNPDARELVAEYFAGTRVSGLTPLRIAELLGLPGLSRVRSLSRLDTIT
jgi:2-polyprenyl-6-methoxyphenol hydroxylase-like FAD-dependent oxidoreductase